MKQLKFKVIDPDTREETHFTTSVKGDTVDLKDLYKACRQFAAALGFDEIEIKKYFGVINY